MAVYPAASFIAANTEYLARTGDDAALSVGNQDCSWVAWAMASDLSDTRAILSKYSYPDSQRSYELQISNAPLIRLAVSDDGTSGAHLKVLAWSGTPLVDTWYFIIAYHDAANNLLGISVNGGAFETTEWTTGLFDNTTAFSIGCELDSSGPSNLFQGRIGPCGVAKGYVLSAADRDELYNSGNGILYAQMSAGLAAKFGGAWWDLREPSDGSVATTRPSCDGTLNLTDNNTVASNAAGPILVPSAAGGGGSIFGGLIVR